MSVSRETLEQYGLNVSRETLKKLAAFELLLLAWNPKINLIGKNDIDRVVVRHLVDSLQLLPYIPLDAATATDMGSGAGFPGLILCIASGTHFNLIESDKRKAAFLHEAVRVTGANATVCPARVEVKPCSSADMITSRALANLPRLLHMAEPLLNSGGTCLFLKGAIVESEIAVARRTWSVNIEQFPSIIDQSGLVLRATGIVRV